MQQVLSRLRKPADFQRTHADVFPTIYALRYHLGKRDSNGLLASGAVVETALGLRIDEERFPVWFLSSSVGGMTRRVP